MKSEIERLWPVEDGKLIWQNHDNFNNYGWTNEQRLAALDRDSEIRRDTERLWLEAGLEVVADHSRPYQISSVKIDFTNDEWVDIFQTEGELLPSCCANISHVRDILMSALRDNGYIGMTDLEEGTRLLAEHHDADPKDPMTLKFIGLWAAVKGDAACYQNIGQPRGVDPNDPKTACHIVQTMSYNIAYQCFWGDDEFEHNQEMVSTLLKLIPAIGTIHNKIKELDPGILRGFAVCKDGQVAETMRGLAMYETEEFANKVAVRFNEQYSGDYTVREAAMSLDEGVILAPIIPDF